MNDRFLDMLLKTGLAAALLILASPDSAFAAVAGDLRSSVDKVTGGMSDMPIVLSGIAYLAAGATMMQGCGLLKKHADNPTGQPLAAGLTRIFAGGFIAAMPYALSWAVNTFAWDGGLIKFPYVPLTSVGGPAGF